MRKLLDAKELTALISARHFRALRDALAGKNEVDIAQFLSRLSPEQAVLAFRTLPKDDASDVFSELDSEMQQGHHFLCDGHRAGRYHRGPCHR